MKKRLVGFAALLLAVAIWSPVFAQDAGPKKVLVISVTKGFQHSSIPTANKVLGELAERSQADKDKTKAFTVDYVKTEADMAAKMTAEELKKYDAFVFANTTGVLPLPDKQAFLDAIKDGKGFVGMHSASDTFHGPPEGPIDPYIEMLGGEFRIHHAQAGVECLVQDPKHPAVKHFGESFCVQQEEIYLMINYTPSKVHELLVLDKHPNHKSKAGSYPISWCKKYGKGNVFYTSLGHREDVWENKAYQAHVLGGIRWALGLEPGDAAPVAD